MTEEGTVPAGPGYGLTGAAVSGQIIFIGSARAGRADPTRARSGARRSPYRAASCPASGRGGRGHALGNDNETSRPNALTRSSARGRNRPPRHAPVRIAQCARSPRLILRSPYYPLRPAIRHRWVRRDWTAPIRNPLALWQCSTRVPAYRRVAGGSEGESRGDISADTRTSSSGMWLR